MSVWIWNLFVATLPKIVCILVLLVILWPGRNYKVGRKIMASICVFGLYGAVMHGDEYFAKKKLMKLCLDPDSIIVDKTVELASSYWMDDGTPKYFDKNNKLLSRIDGVVYKENVTHRALKSPEGGQETHTELVNDDTGEVYAVGKSYGYFGGWYHRMRMTSSQIKYSCFWDVVGESKLSRRPISHTRRLASWVFVPIETGVVE